MKNLSTLIEVCEVCGNEDLESVLDLGLHPMCDDLVPVGDTRVCQEYPIEILFCETCNTAHQKFQVPKRELFPVTYHYRSRFTADVLSGMEGLVDSCSKQFGNLMGKKVLDIGCNDGSLLDFFHKQGAITLGIEPTGAGHEAAKKSHITFIEFLSEDLANKIVDQYGKPDLITFTNVFAHIENLKQVIDSLKILLGPQTVIIIENHYLGSVLRGNQFDTFYHEHPRTYSCKSFLYIARSLGVNLLDIQFPSRYGGNIRVSLGNLPINNETNVAEIANLISQESDFKEKFKALQQSMKVWKDKKTEIINKLVSQHGKLSAKAFPGRAAILIKLLGLKENFISAVFEKPGSLKIGHYLPGTRIPICSDNDLFMMTDNGSPLLNLAWHIPNEIRKYLEENEYKGTIIDIMSPEDFLEM